MIKKGFVAAGVLSIIESIIAFVVNCLASYIFLVVGALVERFGGKDSALLNVMTGLMTAIIIISIIIFVLAVIVLIKTKKESSFKNVKTLLIIFMITNAVVAIVNVVLGVLLAGSLMCVVYVVFALLYALNFILVLMSILKNKKIENAEKSSSLIAET